MDFYTSWHYLMDSVENSLPEKERFLFDVSSCLDIEVVKVNPETDGVDDDESLNTKTQVWLEFGLPEYSEEIGAWIPTHDIGLDCGADTFEEAVILLAGKLNDVTGKNSYE